MIANIIGFGILGVFSLLFISCLVFSCIEGIEKYNYGIKEPRTKFRISSKPVDTKEQIIYYVQMKHLFYWHNVYDESDLTPVYFLTEDKAKDYIKGLLLDVKQELEKKECKKIKYKNSEGISYNDILKNLK